jgi:hypothetical protein
LIAWLLVTTASVASEERTICQTARLVVEGGTLATRDRLCQIVAREIPKLAACNVIVPEGVTIRIDPDLPPNCMGAFHCGEALVRVMPPDLMAEQRKRNPPFELVPDAAYWESMVVHELTHAAYDSVKCPFTECVATAEYAAYAMQVRSLPSETRAAFEAASTFDHRVTRDELNAVYYALAPDHFAQKVWLHFTQCEDGCELMRQIMDGAVFFDREDP